MTKRDFIFITIILVLIFFTWKSCNKSHDDHFEKLYNAESDTLHQVRNKLGQEETKTALILGSISDLRKIHASDSSAIGKLKKEVDHNTISATYLSNTTSNTIASASDIIILYDSVKEENYPEYRDTISDRWQNIEIAANKDSTHIKYKVFNDFNLVQSWERPGFLKRKIPTAKITNLNPHTVTNEFKTFTLKENKGNRLRDGLIGVAVGALLVTGIEVFNVKIPITFRR